MLQPMLILYGLLFASAAVFAVWPKRWSRVALKLNNPRMALAKGLLLILLAAPVLLHYASVLYPLDLVALPVASALFAFGLMLLLFPRESVTFGNEVLSIDASRLRLMMAASALFGLMLLKIGLQ